MIEHVSVGGRCVGVRDSAPLLRGEEWSIVESVLVERYRPLTFGLYSAHTPPSTAERQRRASAEVRALLANRILNVDQKVLYRRDLSSEELIRKCEQYRYLSRVLCENGFPMLQEVVPHYEGLEALRQMKLAVLRILPQLDVGLAGVRFETFCGSPESAKRFPYIAELQRHFGANLSAVCVYGSAVYSDTPADYDNFVVVDDLEVAYKSARGLSIRHNERPVHLNLLPTHLAPQVLACGMIPAVRPSTMCVALGSLSLAAWPDRTLLDHNWVRALEMVRRRRNSFSVGPETFALSLKSLPEADRRALYESFCFVPSVLIEWARRFGRDPHAPLTPKRTIIEELRSQGLPLLPYSTDSERLMRGFEGCQQAMKIQLEEAAIEQSLR